MRVHHTCAIYSCFIAILLFCFPLMAKTPDWVRNYGQTESYPLQRYFTGFGSAALNSDNPGESMERAREHAMAAMLSSIRTRFSVIKRQNTVTVDRSRGQGELFTQFSMDYSSYTTLELEDVHREFYIDKRRKRVFAFVRVNRTDAARGIKNRMAISLMELRNSWAVTLKAAQQGNHDQLRQLYSEVLPKAQALQEQYSLCRIFDNDFRADTGELELMALPQRIRALFSEHPARDIDALAAFLVSGVSFKTEVDGTMLIAPFVNHQGALESFGQEFGYALENSLTRSVSLRLVDLRGEPFVFNSSSHAFDYGLARGAQYLLAYGCFRRDTLIEVHVRLYDLRRGELLSTWVDTFDGMQVKRGYHCSKRFDFDVWVSSGDSVIHPGQAVALMVKTVVPIYLRVIYRFDNGLMAIPDLVYKNLYTGVMDEGVYRLPGLFSFPQSPGEIQILASLKPFPEIGVMSIEYGGELLRVVEQGFRSKVYGDYHIKRRIRAEMR